MKDILLALAAMAVVMLCIAAAVVQGLRGHPDRAVVLLLAGGSICVGALRLAWKKLQ